MAFGSNDIENSWNCYFWFRWIELYNHKRERLPLILVSMKVPAAASEEVGVAVVTSAGSLFEMVVKGQKPQTDMGNNSNKNSSRDLQRDNNKDMMITKKPSKELSGKISRSKWGNFREGTEKSLMSIWMDG
jgi:hypothetical protein